MNFDLGRNTKTHGGLARAVALAVIVLATIAAALASPAAGLAQRAPITWSVQPANREGPDSRAHFVYDLNPGATLSDFVSVSNLSDQPLTLKVYASDAFNTQSGGFDLLTADKAPVDVGSWIKFNNQASQIVTVPAHDKATLPFMMTLPANATPGDHAGGIVASINSPAGGQVTVDYRVGARVYLQVKGTLSPSLAVEGVSLSHEGSLNPFGRGDATLSYTVRNSGNVRLTPDALLEITGPLGISLGSTSGVALPELLPGATYEGKVVVPDIAPALRVSGKLTLTPKLPEGTQAAVSAASASGSTWSVPWTLLLLLVVLAVAVAVLVSVVRRSRRAAALRAEFSPEVVAAVMRHMNTDHASDAVMICRGFGGQPQTASALMTGMDRHAIEFVAVVDNTPVQVRLPWSRPLTQRSQIREEVTRMYRESCVRLGLEITTNEAASEKQPVR